MPYSSADISGMIGGQMAMFSNQAAYSQQIGGMVGTSPMGMAGGMANPFPQSHMGSQIAGGMASSMGGAATGMSIGGGLMGGAAGWMDPFTSAGRGMGMGTGASGFMGGLSNIGGAFAQGGMRAGMGALAGGLGGAAIAAAPAMAVGMAAQYAGGQMYQGAQNFQDVQNMSGHFGSQFGQSGSVGGGMGSQSIKKITGALHELVGDDMRTTMEEIKTVMDKAGQMGMLSGITDANAFKQKFGGIVKQVRQIADIMGTTLSEAAPMMGEMNKMGLWSSADMMGTAVAGKVAGPAAGAMMGAMGQGAQISHAMGGTMRAGAMMGREAFTDVQAAQRAGVLSNRDVMEYTGGVGGAEGQRMMAGGMQRMMSSFSQSSAGQLMMAGLGARGDTGEFTGEIDKGKLSDFMSGNVSVNDLQRQGRKSLTKGNQASFFDVQEELGQNLGAEGGMGAIGKIAGNVLENKFGGNKKLQQQLLRQMTGMSNKDAKLAMTFMENAAKIADEESRATEGAINKAFDDLERKKYRSWEGLTGAVSGSFREGLSRPLQEAGERLAADFGESWDRTVSGLTGKTRRVAMGSAEKGRLLRGGALTKDFGDLGSVGQDFVSGGNMENVIRGIQSDGGMGEIAAGAAVGGATVGLLTAGLGTGMGVAAGAAIGAYTAGLDDEGLTQKSAALRRLGIGSKGGDGSLQMGGGYTTSREEVTRGLRRSAMRAGGASRKAMGFTKDDQGIRTMKDRLTAVMGKSPKLRRLRKENPKGYAAALLKEMDYDVTTENLDKLSIAQQEEGLIGDLTADFAQENEEVAGFPTSFKELEKAQNAALDEMYTLSGGKNLAEGAMKGAAVGALGMGAATGGILAIPGAIGGAAMGLMDAAINDTGVEREDITRAMTGEGSDVMQRYLKGEITADKAQKLLQRVKGSSEIGKLIDKMKTGVIDKKSMATVAQKFEGFRGAEVQIEELAKIKELAARGPSEISLGKGGEGLEGEFKDLHRLYSGGADDTLKVEELREAQKEAQSLASRLTRSQADEFAKAGGVGRQVAALFEVSAGQVGEGMGEKKTKDMVKALEGMDYDLKKDEKLAGYLKDDKITKKESEDFGKRAAEIIKNSMTGTAEATKTHNEKMMEMLNVYADKHEKFVRAVDNAIDLKDPGDAPEAETPTQTEEK